MAQKVLSEAQMREYIEQEVRKALENENINDIQLNESLDEGLDEGLMDLIGRVFSGGKGTSFLGKMIKDHLNFPDLMNLAIGIFGVTPLVKWVCGKFGIDVNGPLANMLISALAPMATVAVGDMIQNRGNGAQETKE